MANFVKRIQLATQLLFNRQASTITSGGIINLGSGMGTGVDKGEGSFFQPTRMFSRAPLEIMCVQSWVAKKAVELPVRDMFLRPRMFLDINDNQEKNINDALKKFKVDNAVRNAMILGRQYGTGLIVLMTKEAPLDTPLNINSIRSGDLLALRVLNRYDASVSQRDYDLYSPTYGQPVTYNIHPSWGGTSMEVHASRVIRFDGLEDAGDSQLTYYDQDWGVSILVPIISAILQQAGIANASHHLVQEASIPVLSIANLRDAVSGNAENEVSVDMIGDQINRMKSIYRLMMLDQGEEEFNRVAVQFGGLADLIDRSYLQVAAAADIPYSRFVQDSPKGMNATGDGDFRNYVMTFESIRQNILPRRYDLIDEVLFRSEGLGEVPEYEWPSLLELTEAESSEVNHRNAQAIEIFLNTGVIDEDEARDMLSGNSLYGNLEGDAPGLPEPELPPAPAAKPPVKKP